MRQAQVSASAVQPAHGEDAQAPTPAIRPHDYFMARATGHRYHALCADEAGRHSSFTVDMAALAMTLENITFDNQGERP